MISFLHNASIKAKLTLVILLSSATLLAVISCVVLCAEIYTSWTVQRQELHILSGSIADSCQQPLLLGQHRQLNRQLDALIHQDNIHAAYVFDDRGIPVAQYLQQRNSRFVMAMLKDDFAPQNTSLWHDLNAEHHLFSFRHFSVFTPIVYEGQRIGILYILSDLQRLYGRLSGVAFGITLSLLVMFLLAWLLAGYLQKPVLRPLLQLARTMDDVADSHDYTLRARKLSHDEVGRLVDGFNRMLRQIESNQKRLAEYQHHLEQKVAERTAELQLAVSRLEQATEQADAANRAKSQFLSRMTHELRTPLIGVLGMNELLTRSVLTEEQKVLVATIQNSGEQLLNLIGDILDFSRIEAGKLQLEMTKFELPKVVADVVTLLTPQARGKRLRLTVDIDPVAAVRVVADETRLRQILINLVGNALKFTSAGSVCLSLSAVTIRSDTGQFLFKVIDTGAGIDADAQAQIFDSFFQKSGKDGTVSAGTGLGLAIVKQLVELMEGTIDVTSTPGKGSCFRVNLELQLSTEEDANGEGGG